MSVAVVWEAWEFGARSSTATVANQRWLNVLDGLVLDAFDTVDMGDAEPWIWLGLVCELGR